MCLKKIFNIFHKVVCNLQHIVHVFTWMHSAMYKSQMILAYWTHFSHSFSISLHFDIFFSFHLLFFFAFSLLTLSQKNITSLRSYAFQYICRNKYRCKTVQHMNYGNYSFSHLYSMSICSMFFFCIEFRVRIDIIKSVLAVLYLRPTTSIKNAKYA